MKTTTLFRKLVLAAAGAGCLLSQDILRADVGDDNPTGTSGIFNGNITTGGSYDAYTANATRSIVDLAVASAVGGYPLAFTRTMNSRYTIGAGKLEFGQAGNWRHNYQWSILRLVIVKQAWENDAWTVMPSNYTVDYPDGRRVSFSASASDTHFRAYAGSGISDRFQPLTDPSAAEGECYLLLPDGGMVYFQATIGREEDEQTHTVTSTFTYQFAGLIDPHGQYTSVTYPADGSTTITEPAGRCLKLFYVLTPWFNNGVRDTVLDRVEERASEQSPTRRSVKYNYAQYGPTPNGTSYTSLASVVYFDDPSLTASYTYQNGNINPNLRPLLWKCVDPMYTGPMWRIAYTFAPAATGVVHGQLQSENHLDAALNVGPAVSTLIINPSTPNTRTETRGDGPPRTLNYSAGKLINYTDFKGKTSIIAYDGNGFVWAFTDARGKTTTTLREGLIGAVTVLTHPDPEQSTQRFAYRNVNGAPYFLEIRGDERNLDSNTYFTRDVDTQRVTKIWYPDYPSGPTEEFTYNNFGQILTHTMTSGGVENFRYDGRGLMYQSWPPVTPSDPNPDQHPTQYFYYLSGPSMDRLWYVIDPRGYSTRFEYNTRGQVTKVTHDQDQTYSQRGYNPDGTLAWTADENHPNASWNVAERTRYVYDDYKRVLTVTNPLNQTTTASYALDWVNPLVHTTRSVKYVNSPMNKNIVFDYDENFRKIDQVAALGTADEAWTLFQYDDVGNLSSVQDPRFHVTTFGYDERNRRTSSTAPDPFNSQITQWAYDTRSNLIRETRPDLSFRRMEYDPQSRVIDTYGFANEHTHYERDLAGNVLQMVDPKPATYSFEYDKMNRKIAAHYPTDATGTDRSEGWHYDFAGNMDQYTNPAGQTKTLGYDTRNRFIYSSWNAGGGPALGLGYDDASRLTSIVTNNEETKVVFGYDDANRQIWEEQTVAGFPPRRVETPRDADGNRIGLQVPGLYSVEYDYTGRNQLRTIFASSTPWFSYSYDAAGNMIKRQNVLGGVNDSTNSMDSAGVSQYDALNRPMMWEQTAAGNAAFAHSHFNYDNLGRLTASWRDEQSDKGEWFGYNATGQLTGVSYNADGVSIGSPQNATRTVSYTIAPNTLNRSSMNDNGDVSDYAPNGLNQYENVAGGNVYYDGNFNLMWSGGLSAWYDSANHLTWAQNGEDYGQFVYDGLGRCLKRTVDWETTLIAYDGWKPIVEWDEWNNLKAWNVYGAGADEILYRHDANLGDLRYHLDRMGNIAFLLDSDGDGIERYTYDAFGHPTVTDWNGENSRPYSWYGNRFMFTGREYFPGLGLYDYRNRFYYPILGRFLQSDPTAFDAGDANLFRYCGGDPVNFTDPSGLMWRGPFPNPQIPLTQAQLQYFQGMTFAGMFGAASLAGQGRWGPATGFAIGVAVYYLSQPYPPSGGSGGPGGISPGGTDIQDFGGSMDITNGQALPQSPTGGSGGDGSAGSAGGAGGAGGNGGYVVLYVSSSPGYWSYANYEARHQASMASSNFSSTMAPFWDPGNPNNTGTTTDAGHTIFFAGGQYHGHAEDGVVTAVPGGFGQRDSRWVFPSQAESARLGLSYNDPAHVNAYNDWLIAHNQWFYGGR